MWDLIFAVSLFFFVGYVVGKILAKMHRFCLLFWSLMLMPILYSDPPRNLLIATVTFIFGEAYGYKLFPAFFDQLESVKISVELFFARRRVKKASRISTRQSRKKEDLKQEARENRRKAEELRRKEQELNRRAEQIRREQRQKKAELKRERERQVNHPSTLQEAFEVLGTCSGLSLEEYKKIWRNEVLKYHPDRTAGLGERLRQQAEEEMKAINRAWEIIRLSRY
ncbi:MAG: J domain-containing protein [Candidatus Electrothrix sp. GM3_4]|nr:J domain-containing protein [Candidatus Electrothrix sp. GM3_4]